jgi:pimeloyl-ACP methyl ester carboxylesterase
MQAAKAIASPVQIPSGSVLLSGDLQMPTAAQGVVLFAHGSGSSRLSPRNRFVAGVINRSNLGTLLFDLLTREEEEIDAHTRHLRFDIDMLARRLTDAAKWTFEQDATRGMNVGLFGASTGAAAALMTAAELGSRISAVVSRGGRPDLAGDALDEVTAPTLLIVGGLDDVVIGLNEEAFRRLRCEKEMKIIAGATHLFEEPGKLEAVADIAAEWFRRHLD